VKGRGRGEGGRERREEWKGKGGVKDMEGRGERDLAPRKKSWLRHCNEGP